VHRFGNANRTFHHLMDYNPKQSQVGILNKTGEQLSLVFGPPSVRVSDVIAPTGYTGLSAFHKYWGKKPIECLGFLIEKLTNPHDIVVDPFVGSGLIARECALRERRFIGIDINPVSIELARLISNLPSLDQYLKALAILERDIRCSIDESYQLADGRTASHYLWDRNTMKEIWIPRNGRNSREVLAPTGYDHNQFAKHEKYTSRFIRPLRFFQNTRINTSPTLGLSDIFTGRALRNIDLLLQHITTSPDSLRGALLLTLTASVGQMSNMVFAITGRGKTKGSRSGNVEVGSWVIGYWRPPLHFEVNVWNCFRRRSQKLITSLRNLGAPRSFKPSDQVDGVLFRTESMALLNEDSIHALKQLPNSSVALVLTDPPHSDRIPYLELSELWNALLGRESDFDKEIVVSNARERKKTKIRYNQQMADLLVEVGRVLIPGGTLALLFNARDADSWKGLVCEESGISLRYHGCFPMTYSANSVVQDNREGAMKSDYVLIYRKPGTGGRSDSLEEEVQEIPGWSEGFPSVKGAKDVLHISGG